MRSWQVACEAHDQIRIYYYDIDLSWQTWARSYDGNGGKKSSLPLFRIHFHSMATIAINNQVGMRFLFFSTFSICWPCRLCVCMCARLWIRVRESAFVQSKRVTNVIGPMWNGLGTDGKISLSKFYFIFLLIWLYDFVWLLDLVLFNQRGPTSQHYHTGNKLSGHSSPRNSAHNTLSWALWCPMPQTWDASLW